MVGEVAGTELTLGNSPLMEGFDSMWEILWTLKIFFFLLNSYLLKIV